MNAPMHTPGPWKRVAKTGKNRFRICDSNGHMVADANTYNVDAESNTDLIAVAPELLAAAKAAMEYDAAIQSCANDPARMASFCTAEGDDLDTLYARWQSLSRAAFTKATGSQS